MWRLLCITILIFPAIAAAADLDEAELDRRIEQNRKGDFVVELRDANGKPVSGDAHFELTWHTFGFGTAVNADFILHPSSAGDLKHYEQTLTQYFNCAVAENAMKWAAMEHYQGKIDTTTPMALWQWCHDRGIPMRGHCIFWGQNERWVPPWALKLDAPDLEAAMKSRLRQVTGEFAGKIDEWDLNNEMLHGDVFTQKLGLKNGAAYFQWAKQIAPDVRFCVNDYAMQEKRMGEYVKQIRAMLDDGAAIGGIGEQAHFHKGVPDNEELWDDLDQLAQFKLPIKITEFDDKTADPQLQAANLRRFFKVCFAHPSVTAILQWGFWEGRHWRPEAALWRKDWSIKPNGEAYVKLIDDEWKTRGDGKVVDGTLRFRGFFGQYVIRAGMRMWSARIDVLLDGQPAWRSGGFTLDVGLRPLRRYDQYN